MTEAADLVLRNAEVHALTDPDRTAEAVAVRSGRIVRVDDDYEVDFLVGVDTTVIDLDGRVLLPGFVDAHTHLEEFGKYLVHGDLSAASSPEECVELLREGARDDREWILGYGWDESAWGGDPLDRDDLDAVSEERPVVAFRVDMHTAAVNGVALARLRDEMPDGDVRTVGGEPTGLIVEDALGPVREATAPDREATAELVTAARDRAHELGVTGVHEMVRNSHAPRVYRDLAAAGDLDLRVRLNYWRDHLDELEAVGLGTNHGGAFVRSGAIKTFTDGSVGGRTAKVSDPYADADPSGSGDEATGQWVVPPAELRDMVKRADGADYQVAAHAIGDEAVEAALSAYEDAGDPGGARHRIEHAELATDDQIGRMAAAGVVASVQPNFHRWAGEGGLYETALGPERARRTNRLRALVDAGVQVAFGSDCMPLDPLLGVHHAVAAPAPAQRLSVTEALRAYTLGSAYAGFDEDRIGTVEAGKRADLVALDRSPWDHPEAIDDVAVALTVVDGTVVYDDR